MPLSKSVRNPALGSSWFRNLGKTEAKPRFLNHEEPRAGFLTDLDNGTVIQLPQTAKPKDYIYSVACVV